MITSKLFWLKEIIWRVESKENKKAEKKEAKGAQKFLERFSKKKKKKKNWLMRMHQSKILHVFTQNLYQNVAEV